MKLLLIAAAPIGHVRTKFFYLGENLTNPLTLISTLCLNNLKKQLISEWPAGSTANLFFAGFYLLSHNS